MSKKTYGLFLTESTLLLLGIHLILGPKLCVLGTYSYIQNHGGYLQKLVNYLNSKQLLEVITDKVDKFPYKDNGDLQRLTNVFYECETWMEEEFKMDSFKGSYAQACSILSLIERLLYTCGIMITIICRIA